MLGQDMFEMYSILLKKTAELFGSTCRTIFRSISMQLSSWQLRSFSSWHLISLISRQTLQTEAGIISRSLIHPKNLQVFLDR